MLVGKLAHMNTPRTAIPIAPGYRQRSQRRLALLMLTGSAAGLVWLGAMIYTLAGWIM